ncbi:BTAD domain-containing putative transcriptional regulator [Crossiella sp. CA198]|uniref:AfsR/SARP family transcriptional regulator n=1 Tax=Crossiella sp. CA198 TaxID=3455607 RepID=UPI003F8CF656
MPELSIHLLGPFQLFVDGAEVPVPSGRQRALLATLALAAGHPVAVTALAEAVWGEEQPANVRASLHTNVMRLRHLIGPERIGTEPDAYRLRAPAAAVDVHRFRDLLTRADHSTDPAAERALLDTALAQWHGQALESLPLLAAEHEPRLTELRLRATERLADLAPDPGLADRLRTLLAAHPLREPLWERLIRVLAQTGRRAEALAEYAACRRLFAAELGVEPGPALRELHLELLADKDEPAPVPRQLPFDIGHFTGRAGELTALDRAARPGSVLVIEGSAGVGKSALAVRWAHLNRHRFPGGELCLDLRGHADAAPLPVSAALDTLLRGLGVPAAAIPSTVDERGALLRATLVRRKMLLLLDNAREVDQVRPLLPGGAAVVLVTSRTQLRGLIARDGARRITLGGLSGADAAALLGRGIGADRAAAEPEAVRRLSTLCGQLPLALVLAGERASRFPDTPVAELVDELKDQRSRLDVLTDPQDPRTDLRAAFLLSYQGVRPPAARLFRLLGLHPGPDVDLWAAAALAGTGPRLARALLDDLVAAHLIAQPRPGRYRFHDLLRVYAAERADTEETPPEHAAALHRLTELYLVLAARGRALLSGSPRLAEVCDPDSGQPDWPRFSTGADALTWCEAEHANLLALTRQLAGTGLADPVWRLPWLLLGYLRNRRHLADWVELARLGVVAADRLADPVARFHAANCLGVAYNSAGRAEEARGQYREALAVAEEMGDRTKAAVMLNNLGTWHYDRGEHAEAVHYQERALAEAEATGSPAEPGIPLLNLGGSHARLRQFAQSLPYNQRALALFEREGDRFHAAIALGNLAETHWGLGEYQTALTYAERADAEHRELGAPSQLANNLIFLGRIAAALGDPGRARLAWTEARDIYRRTGDRNLTRAEDLLGGSVQ